VPILKISDLITYLRTARLVRIIVPCVVFVSIVAYGLEQNQHSQTVFRATARIWVQRSLFEGGRSSQPGEIPDSPLIEGSTNLATFCEVVQSDAVLSLAHDELSKMLPADQVPPRGALAGVKVVPTKDANIITIEFRDAHPGVPQKVVESIIHGLLTLNSNQIAGPLEETRERLNKQLEIARQDYGKSKDRLKEFEKSVGALDFQAEAASLSGARSDLEQQIDEAQNELKSLHVKIGFLEQQLGFGPDDVMAVEKISNDEVVNNLKQTIASNEVKLIELKSKFQDDHPRVKRLKGILADARKEMADRYSSLIGKVDPKFDGISPSNDAQHELLGDMIEANTEVVVGESKIVSLKESLNALNAKVEMLPKMQQELDDLQRQDELATNTLAAVESELQRVKLTESVSLSSSRLQVIDSGQTEEKLGALPMLVFYSIALVVAGVAAFIQVVADPRVCSISHLRTVGFPTVGWFPELRGDLSQSISYADRVRLSIKNWLTESKIIWITSAGDNDGKSFVCYTLVQSFCDAGYKVAVIDANMQHPKLHILFGVKGSPGLMQFFEDEDEPIAVQKLRRNLKFVAAGGITDNERILSSNRFQQLVDELERWADVVIIDGRPSGDHECALQVAECRPNLLVVVRLGNTFRSALRTLINQLNVVPLGQSGLIINSMKVSDVGKIASSAIAIAPAPAEAEAAPTETADRPKVEATANW
jgi:Mrp family chromosome partitioning ATPase/uncharacterized protein involved in exopolysaccharide biosynthesis